MPSKKQKKGHDLFAHYTKIFSGYGRLLQRALFSSPKRITGLDHNANTLTQKIKSFFSHSGPSLLILIASAGFLLYALYTSLSGTNKGSAMLVHNVSDVIDTIAIDDTPSLQSGNEAPQSGEQLAIVSSPQDTPADAVYKQLIDNLYTSINTQTYSIGDYFDSYMRTSDLVKTYFTPQRLQKLAGSLDGGFSLSSIEIFDTLKTDRIGVRYVLHYTLRENKQEFAEQWEVILLPQSGGWRIGTIRCETRGCSTHPFFHFEKYGIR